MNIFHIPLSQRKTICGRLLFFKAAYPDQSKFRVAGAASEFDQVRDNVFRLTEQAVSSSTNSQPLDQFLNKLHTDLGDQMRPQLNGKYAALFGPLYADFGESVAALSCNQCSPLRPRVCDGGNKDDEIVGTSGACIAPLREMFEIAAQAAKERYARSSNLFRLSGSPGLVFSTGFTNGKPDDIPGDYFVGGVTRHYDAPATAEINLIVSPKKFDWKTYAATLYVLFHECICHAYQGTMAFRPKPLSDGFAEGWMDWIAFECFRRHVLEMKPRTPMLQAYLDAGTELHLLRVNDEHPQRSDQSSICAFGRSVAQKFGILLERLPATSEDPWSSLLMTSFDLNIAGGISDQELVLLDDYLSERGQLDSPKLEYITEAVNKYFVSKDISNIFQFLSG